MQHDDEEEKEDLEVDVVLDESLLLLKDVEEQLDELQDELFIWLLEVLEEELEHEEIEVQDVDKLLELSENEEEHEMDVLGERLELEELKPEDDALLDIPWSS